MQFTLGAFLVDPSRNCLFIDSRTINLEPQIMDVLCALARSPGEVVSRDQLIEQVWSVKFGADESLTRAISELRKAIRVAGETEKYIETVYKRGYRLSADVRMERDASPIRDGRSAQPVGCNLAVLPFEDMSPEKDQGHFADGVSEEIINALAQNSELRIAGRTSSFSFKGSSVTIGEIGKQLGATHILEGSVRKHGNTLRITVQLIEASGDIHLWSRTYDGTLENIFEFQEQIAREVGSEVLTAIGVSGAVAPRSDRPPLTDDYKAYEYFIRGRALTEQYDGINSLPKAIDLLEQAVAFDSNFPDAWAYLARANFYMLEHLVVPDWRQHLAAGRLALRRAIQLEPENPIVQSTNAYIALLDLNIDERVQACETAHHLDPNTPIIKYTFGSALSSIGLPQNGLDLMEEAIHNEPLAASWINGLANAKYALGDFEGAMESYQRSFDLGFEAAIILKAGVLAHLGKPDQAIACVEDHANRMGPLTRSFGMQKLLNSIGYAAFFEKRIWARTILYIVMSAQLKNRKTQPTSTLPFRCGALGYPVLFMDAIRANPHPYMGSTLAQIWTPTEEARRVRSHKSFPKFAEDIGLIRAWQTYGWPKQVYSADEQDASKRFVVRA